MPSPLRPPSLNGLPRKLGRRRRRLPWVKLLLSVAVLAGVGVGLRWWLFPGGGPTEEITAAATRGTLAITVTERGELESSNNVEVRCEVEGSGNKIVWILPEGSRVKKGEKVVTFDTDTLNKARAEQAVKVELADGKMKAAAEDLKVAKNKAEDDVEQAKLKLRLAELDRDKYIDEQGEYTAEVQDKKGALALAKKDLAESADKLEQFRKSVKKGLFPAEQLRLKEADYAQKEFYVKRDEAKLVVLEKFTRQRQVEELTAKAADAKRALDRAVGSGEASIAKAQSELNAAKSTLALEKQTLERIDKQIEKCTVPAPEDGILVYSKERWWDDNSRIQAGAIIHYRQPIFSLPDLAKMQMKVKVHESMIKKVQAGQKAEIRIDAAHDRVLHGTVKSVATLANADGFFDRFVKQYETIITIEDLPADGGLKPGFTGDVKILANEIPNVLLVPVQAVAQREGQHVCYVAGPAGVEARPVKVGENNEKFVEIQEGLEEGTRVVLDARARMAAEVKAGEGKVETVAKPPAANPGRAPGGAAK